MEQQNKKNYELYSKFAKILKKYKYPKYTSNYDKIINELNSTYKENNNTKLNNWFINYILEMTVLLNQHKFRQFIKQFKQKKYTNTKKTNIKRYY